MPTGQPQPILAPPAADQDSQATLVEPTPLPRTDQSDSANRSGLPGTTRTPETELPVNAETLIEPVAGTTPLVARQSSVTTGRSATAPVAEQETLIEAPGGSGTQPTTKTKAKTGKRFDIPQVLGDYELLEEL